MRDVRSTRVLKEDQMALSDESRLRSRHAWMIACLIGLQVVTYLAVVLVVGFLRNPPIWLRGLVVGAVAGQCCLLSAVAVLGPWRLLIRLAVVAAIVVAGV